MSDTEVSSPSDVVEASESPPVTPPDYSTPTGCAQVWIDGVDVTNCAVAGTSTRRLNRPSQAQVRLPMDCAIGGVGSRLVIEFGGSPHHHGRVLVCETECDEDSGYTVYNSTDPMEMWDKRPARDGPDSSDPGDMSNPLMFSGEDFPPDGPTILNQMLLASEDSGLIPSKAEGPLFLDYGTFETDGCDLSGAPTDWPMTIAEVTSLMVSTGCLDVVITPNGVGSGNMGTVSAYNGDYGTDRSGSVVFDYGQGNYNIRRLRWNQDMSMMCNKLWYYMGPRIQTPADPAGDQHWCFNVTGTDPGMIALDPIPNGESVATLLANRSSSQGTYGVRMDVQIFDAGECTPADPSQECCGGDPLTAIYRQIWRRRWQTESWIRQSPRELIHITPTRGSAIGTFDIGDLVGVSASSAVRGGFSGAQRVYEYSISWEDDGVCFLSELQTSPTAD